MEITELLKQRYKLVGNAPCVKNKLGEIFTVEHPSGRIELDFFFNDLKKVGFAPDDYPLILKKLEWWEERKIEDMPKYAKDRKTNEIYKAREWIFLHHNQKRLMKSLLEVKIFDSEKTVDGNLFLPATESEYIAFINQSKNPT